VEQADLTATAALTAGTTAVVALAWAGNDVRLYVNGGDAKADTGATMPTGSHTLFLGQSGGNANQLNGAEKHLPIWNRALSAQEVANVFAKDYLRWIPALAA
jgi:hypothetical protein